MSSRPRLFTRFCLAATVPVVGGCLSGGKPHVTTIEPPSPRDAAPIGQDDSARRPSPESPATGSQHQSADAQADAESSVIDALKRKSEAYAQALEILLKERDSTGGAPSAPPPRGSAVQWVDTSKAHGTAEAAIPATQPSAEPKEVADSEIRKSQAAEPIAPASRDESNTPLALADAADSPPAIAMITPNPQSVVTDSGVGTSPLIEKSPAEAGALLTRLSRRVKENPKDVASHLEYQMLLFLMDEQVPDLASIATLPQEDRELVTALLDGISNLRATLRRDANLLIAEKIRPVVELSDRLRTGAELTIQTMTLCSRVDGFGRYEVMEPRFIAGRESPTIVYCEIENFSSQYEDGQWQTSLSMELSLFTEMGQQVYVETPAAISDTSRSRRHDFFVRKLIKLPSNLTIGRYVLKVTIVDTQGSRVAESSLPMQIVAQ